MAISAVVAKNSEPLSPPTKMRLAAPAWRRRLRMIVGPARSAGGPVGGTAARRPAGPEPAQPLQLRIGGTGRIAEAVGAAGRDGGGVVHQCSQFQTPLSSSWPFLQPAGMDGIGSSAGQSAGILKPAGRLVDGAGDRLVLVVAGGGLVVGGGAVVVATGAGAGVAAGAGGAVGGVVGRGAAVVGVAVGSGAGAGTATGAVVAVGAGVAPADGAIDPVPVRLPVPSAPVATLAAAAGDAADAVTGAPAAAVTTTTSST
ncbi:MAG: hypothetical protein R2749_16650 [Acidimicrobiales bacterium]